jgi:hypothetical protein
LLSVGASLLLPLLRPEAPSGTDDTDAGAGARLLDDDLLRLDRDGTATGELLPDDDVLNALNSCTLYVIVGGVGVVGGVNDGDDDVAVEPLIDGNDVDDDICDGVNEPSSVANTSHVVDVARASTIHRPSRLEINKPLFAPIHVQL